MFGNFDLVQESPSAAVHRNARALVGICAPWPRRRQSLTPAELLKAGLAASDRAYAAAENERAKAVVDKRKAEKEALITVRQADLDNVRTIAAASAAASRVVAAPRARVIGEAHGQH